MKSRQFRAFSLSTYDFSTLYTTLPHNLIKEKLNDLTEWTFHKEDSLYLACNVRNAFFTSEVHKNYTSWTCQKVCEALAFLLDNIYIRFGTKIFRQIVSIPMGKNCAPLVADLFLFCFERDFMMSLSVENQSEIIEAFSSTSFSVLLVLRLPRLGKRELILVLFVRKFGLCLFRFVGFLFLLGSGKGCGL